jgi:hypothetical protein
VPTSPGLHARLGASPGSSPRGAFRPSGGVGQVSPTALRAVLTPIERLGSGRWSRGVGSLTVAGLRARPQLVAGSRHDTPSMASAAMLPPNGGWRFSVRAAHSGSARGPGLQGKAEPSLRGGRQHCWKVPLQRIIHVWRGVSSGVSFSRHFPAILLRKPGTDARFSLESRRLHG